MDKETKHLVEGANKWMYEDGGTEKWVNEEPEIGDGEEENLEPEESEEDDNKEQDEFTLANDLISGVTYEQLINTVEANEQVKDEDAVDRVFEEELNRVIEDARENFELNKDKLMAGLTSEDNTNEGMFSKGKSKEEQLAKSMIRIIKDKGVDVKSVVNIMMQKLS